MSHELRNPLNVIVGYSELLVRNQRVAQSTQLLEMAEAIKRNALAQSKLIRDLLDLSRLRSGKLQLNLESVSVVVATANAIDTIRSEADAKHILIETVASDEALFVDGDSVRLEQIVWNLLNNSVKFTSAGAGREDLPVLALTGFGRPEDIERTRSEGFFSHLTKPFDVATLLSVLQRVPRKTCN